MLATFTGRTVLCFFAALVLATPMASAQAKKLKHYSSAVAVPVSPAAKQAFGCEPAGACKNCDGTLAYQLCLLDTYYEVQRPNGNLNITMQKSKASTPVDQFKP